MKKCSPRQLSIFPSKNEYISDKIQTVSPSLFTDELDTGYAEEVAKYVEQFYTAEEEIAELAV